MRTLLVTVPLAVQLAAGAHAGDAPDQAPPSDLQDLLNQPVSSASKYQQRASDAPASVSVITSEEMRAFGYQTLAEALASVRGFYLSNDRTYTYVGVRGIGRSTDFNNRILILLDGHTLNENVFGSAYVGRELGGLDLATVERIEVVRGPGSALYGNNAMCAVINVVTKDASRADKLQVGGAAGSWGQREVTARGCREFANGVSLLFSGQLGRTDGQDLYFSAFDDPSTNSGVSAGLDWERYHGGQAILRYADLRVEGFFTAREKGIPTAAWGMDFNDPRAASFDERGFLEVAWDKALDDRRGLLLRAYYDHYQYHGTFPYAGSLEWDASHGRWFGGEARYRWDLSSSQRLVLGAEYTHHDRASYEDWTPDIVYFRDNFPYRTASAYLSHDWQLHRALSLTWGLRWDDDSTADAGVTPRAALLLNPAAGTTVKLLYGRAFRNPNVYERAPIDPLTSHPVEVSLQPERIRSLELVLEQQLGASVVGMASVYRDRVDDLIDTAVNPADSSSYFQNAGALQVAGAEGELRARLRWDLAGYCSYSYQRAEDVATGLVTTNSPRHLLKAGLAFPLTSWLQPSVESAYESSRLTVMRTASDAHLVTNLMLTTRPTHPAFAHVGITLQVTNLFDQRYTLPARYEHAEPTLAQDGRRLFLRVETGL